MDIGSIWLSVTFVVAAPDEIDGKPNIEGLEVATEVNERAERFNTCLPTVQHELEFIESQRGDYDMIDRCGLYIVVRIERSYLIDGAWSEPEITYG